MLASGGQIVFLGIWVLSRRTGQRLEDISFDATANKKRIELEAIEGMIFRKGKKFCDLIASDNWSNAMTKMRVTAWKHARREKAANPVKHWCVMTSCLVTVWKAVSPTPAACRAHPPRVVAPKMSNATTITYVTA